MDMGSWAVVVAAGFGSTGIAGLLASGVQWTRRARLQRTIRTTAAVMETLPCDGPGFATLQRANTRDAIRLGAMTLVTVSARTRHSAMAAAIAVIVVTIAACLISLLAIQFQPSPPGGDSTAPVPLSPATPVALSEAPYVPVATTVVYIICVTALIDGILWQRREAFVRRVLDTVDDEAIMRGEVSGTSASENTPR
ncbi:hypothetical protein [Leifsonia sp. LS-T14]|uniref:hypothetical protein n=1 Tax=unclassified Leifsonia TaxID=2663824 RepID=UPI0035A57B00